MYVIDSGGDYYRCNCYYTFDFIFKQEGTTINQKYKILLTDQRKENPVIIAEGILAESK